MLARLTLIPAVLACCAAALTAQEPKVVGYPQRDLLSPFRNPTDVYGLGEERFRLLRLMQERAARPNLKRYFDETGREMVDDDVWRSAYRDVFALGLDAGVLAKVLREHGNGPERKTAMYGAFYVADPTLVIELIEHIAGEPDRHIREDALPRAIEFLRKNLARTFGDLSMEQQDQLLKSLPQVGSPAAKAVGLRRSPHESDKLFSFRVVPFLQMLDLDDHADQAQAMWFLAEVFRLRPDLALTWLEPSLPRVRQLLLGKHPEVRAQAIALLRSIGPRDLREAPSDPAELPAWAEEATRNLFAPIRNLNDSIIQLHPSPERDAVAAAAVAGLEGNTLGIKHAEQHEGQWTRGFRLTAMPDALKPLALPVDAIITHVNGAPVSDAASLLATVRDQITKGNRPLRLFVDYVLHGKPRAIEYRIE